MVDIAVGATHSLALSDKGEVSEDGNNLDKCLPNLVSHRSGLGAATTSGRSALAENLPLLLRPTSACG